MEDEEEGLLIHTSVVKPIGYFPILQNVYKS